MRNELISHAKRVIEENEEAGGAMLVSSTESVC